jgi:hypothetical protein
MEDWLMPEKPYLSICAIYRDEAPYLREWVEFHRLIGAERFFLYDNLSTDHHLEALAPYTEDGTVVLHEWAVPNGQLLAYEHCLEQHRHDSRWIAFLDIDEFLFSPAGQPVSELLIDYEAWPGVGVNWAMFGTSGHRTKPPGLVVESYVRRVIAAPLNSHIKSIVDPTRTVSCGPNPHYFLYRDGQAVDENRCPLEGAWSTSVSFSRLRINHYWTKSEAEARSKFGKGTADESQPREWSEFVYFESLPQETDEAITAYVPALREALLGGRRRRLRQGRGRTA